MSVRLLELIAKPLQPFYLYYGSPDKIEILKPQQAGVSERSDIDGLYKVFASHRRDFAIPFSYTFYPNYKNERIWSLSLKSNEIEVMIEAGNIDLDREGYLYCLPSDVFWQIDQFQWVSDTAVMPLSFEIIKPLNYIHLIKQIDKSKPPFLYHGSPHKIEMVKPNLAQGVGNNSMERLHAVYASHQRSYAVPYALSIYPDSDSNCTWSLSWTSEKIQVEVTSGIVDLSKEGYLYKLPSDTFRQVGQLQWISDVPVKPLDYEIIKPINYIDSLH